MSNPLLQQQTNQYNIPDPRQIIKDNPQLQQILALYNGDAKTAFYSLCKQKGVDPNIILSQLKNN